MFKKISTLLVATSLLCVTVAVDQSDAKGKSKSSKKSSYATSVSASKSKNVYYKNCTAAKKAGAAPIYKGQPGYRLALDRDKDGIACE